MITELGEIVKWDEVVPQLGCSAREMFADDAHAFTLALILIKVCNIWDDLVDKDHGVSDAAINYSYKACLIDMPRNPFYRAYQDQLLPLMESAILCYITANRYEQDGDEHGVELGHFMRYAVVQVIVQIVTLKKGFDEAARLAPRMYKAFCDDRVEHYKEEVLSNG